MSANANRLLTEHKQLAKLQRKTTPRELGWSIAPVGDNLSLWTGVLYGPPSSPYDGGSFRISLDFNGTNYPHRSPKVRFVQVPWHPNVYVNGNICVDFLASQWTPAYKIESILRSLQSLLDDPNCSSPANPTAAQQWMKQRAVFCAKVRSEMERFGCVETTRAVTTSDDNAATTTTGAAATSDHDEPPPAAAQPPVEQPPVEQPAVDTNDPDADDDF